jgi:hypothetical protein
MLTKRHLRWRHLLVLLGAGGLAGCVAQPELQTVYCYRTLADVTCRLEPDQGREERLVGTYLRDPASQQQVPDPSDAKEEPEGWFLGLVYASVDLAGRILSPVGSVVGMFR